jgi:hypothetical protein
VLFVDVLVFVVNFNTHSHTHTHTHTSKSTLLTSSQPLITCSSSNMRHV